MKPKNYWIGCFIFLLAGSAYGQVHLGATTAYNATFVLDKGLSDDPRYNSTYTYQLAPIGFNFGVDFGRKFGLQLESILSNQGQIYDMINVAEQIAGQRKIDLQYINLPLMMKFMGGGNGKARTNFNFGPQMSILTKAVESIQANAGTFTIPTDLTFEDIQNDFPTAIFDQATGGYTLPGPGTYPLPSGVSFDDIKSVYPGAVDAGNGEYTLPANASTMAKDLLTKEANNFKNAEFQIAMAFGVDIDLSKHLYLSTQIRANYSLTDMRNG
ncbi:MAG TPA: outer membrane beta-barrel protein, partial [Cyclobacteriaceae bacterium]|nr:outer membrane beta-barrel protein [Cyclobacteriaceae bacterium]